MLFNSLGFAFFLPIVFLIYWFGAKDHLRRQNFVLLIASYFFYACWDYRFLFLLIFSTVLDYYTGIKIEEGKTQSKKKLWLTISVVTNLGFLGVFKYYNFFVQSFVDSVSYLGLSVDPFTLQIILPVGISFYTFHGLSYVIDIYYGRIRAERNFIEYADFVSFFPLLVAGPIERATHLLPQMKKARTFSYSQGMDGLRLMLWGFFKKIVIADNCAPYVDQIFSNYESASGAELVLGAVFFAIQIYGDFSGYSDIALGTAKLFGIELMINFRTPYFSRDIAEFWRRWHISLSSWFRDYLYIPLGGSKGGKLRAIRNTFIVFIVSGFWHGANWTFIVWGLLNAIYFLPLLIFDRNRQNMDVVARERFFPNFKEVLQIALTFGLTCVAWVFFRSETVGAALNYLNNVVDGNFMERTLKAPPRFLFFCLALFLIIEWLIRNDGINGLIRSVKLGPVRYAFYLLLICVIGLLGAFGETEFIYFQF